MPKKLVKPWVKPNCQPIVDRDAHEHIRETRGEVRVVEEHEKQPTVTGALFSNK